MPEITREEILEANPLLEYIASKGIKIVGSGEHRTANGCAFGRHKENHFPVTLDLINGHWVWSCHDHDHQGGSIIDWLMHESNRSKEEVIKELVAKLSNRPAPSAPSQKRLITTYDYTDAMGKLVYQVCRYEPKDFRQRRPDGNGGWIWNMEECQRYLYNLPAVLASNEVVVVEGEKDADNLDRLGLVATCNVGGAKKWEESYSQCLAGKHVVIVPDTDTPGQEHAAMVLAGIQGRAASVKIVKLPKGKDISDYLLTLSNDPSDQKLAIAIVQLFEATPYAVKPLDVFSFNECMEACVSDLLAPKVKLGLNNFLPSLDPVLNGLVAGEMVAWLASTGAGKTAMFQKIASAVAPTECLLFSMELPKNLLTLRFIQMEANVTQEEAERMLKGGARIKTLNHVKIMERSGLTVDQIHEVIVSCLPRMGFTPKVVFVDYIGIVRSEGKSRYEASSNTAENLKVLAKNTSTIVFAASQIARPDKKSESIVVGLYDAKDSGSIENSAGLVIGMWRPEPSTIKLKILKNTKGASGKTIECNFDQERLQITERAHPRYAES